jgi:hypothetical protein
MKVFQTIENIVIPGFADSYIGERWYLPELPIIPAMAKPSVYFKHAQDAFEFYMYCLKIIKDKESGFKTLESIAEDVTKKIKCGTFYPALVIRDTTQKSNFEGEFQGEFGDFVAEFELKWGCYGFPGETPEDCVKGIIEESINKGITPDEFIDNFS